MVLYYWSPAGARGRGSSRNLTCIDCPTAGSRSLSRRSRRQDVSGPNAFTGSPSQIAIRLQRAIRSIGNSERSSNGKGGLQMMAGPAHVRRLPTQHRAKPSLAQLNKPKLVVTTQIPAAVITT